MNPSSSAGSYPGVSASGAGFRGRCPRCGKGKLFAGYLTTRDSCSECGLDYGFTDAGDGPAVFIILIVGFLVVGLALVVEFAVHPPYWVHMVVWIPLVLILSFGMLRPLKGWFIGQQFRHKAAEGRLADE
ncbi:MAG: DUF983 domain-containing protein [Bauldia sp.]|nr:DUF983 domain-containing protein [Bauldia sp.]